MILKQDGRYLTRRNGTEFLTSPFFSTLRLPGTDFPPFPGEPPKKVLEDSMFSGNAVHAFLFVISDLP